jgi:IclR family pca regulon transcriptional regulator
VAEASGLPRPTAFRFLKTLEAEGYVTISPTSKRYRLTPAVLELGFAALRSLGIGATVTPYLEALAEETGGVANLTALDRGDIVYLARVASTPEIRRLVTMRIGVGSRIPAHCSAMGRVHLSTNPEALEALLSRPLERLTVKTNVDPDSIRRAVARTAKHGYSIVEEELALGFNGLSVPVNTNEFSSLALGLTVQTSDYSRSEIVSVLIPKLHATAALISSGLTMP